MSDKSTQPSSSKPESCDLSLKPCEASAGAKHSESEKRIERRNFLKATAAASAVTLALGAPNLVAQENEKPAAKPSIKSKTKPTADTVILLWMAGGMAAPDTFDPKRYVPFNVGTPLEKIISTFPAIDTVVDNIKFTKGLENIANVMDRGTLIRSHVLPDLGHILHSRHQYHWHTGYVPPQTVAAPHIGAWISKLLGPMNEAIPAFLDIGQRLEGVGEKEELKAFHTAGFLGTEFGPFLLPYPNQAIAAVKPPAGMTPGRFENRNRFFERLVQENPDTRMASDYHQQSLIRSMENAYKILSSPHRTAFDLSLEPKASFDKYDTGRFGRGCLLARRLCEAGARFIEVTTEYVPFVSWDTHENGHTTVAAMKEQIDRPVAQLILDLEERGLLDRTLVVLASEFSRDMMIEGIPGSNARDQSRAKTDVLQEMKQYGQHRHWTGSSSVLMFGGGIKKGQLYGETANERPIMTTKDPISVTDLHATIFHALGIAPDTAFDIEQRPFYVTKDGKGNPRLDLFA